jgi:hypothetical protein
MKTWEDVISRMKAELEQWFIKQCQNIFDDYYLWYLPTTAEHDGELLIAKEKPANIDFQLAWPKRINKGLTKEQNLQRLYDTLRKLPILTNSEVPSC